LVWHEVIRHVKHGILECGSIVEMVVLWDNVVWALFEFSRRMVVNFGRIVEAREENSRQLLELYGLRIMHCNNEFISSECLIVDWAIQYGVILSSRVAGCDPRSLDADAGQFFADQVTKDPTAGSHRSREVFDIVIGYVLSSCTREGIVVLVDTHVVEDCCLGLHNLFDLALIGVLLNDSLGELFVGSVNMCLTISNLLFGSLTRCVVARPAVIRVIAIREHVKVADGPSDILGLKCVEVLSWGRIEDLDVLAVVLVEVLNEIIHVLEV
jgi:hypothetical protein